MGTKKEKIKENAKEVDVALAKIGKEKKERKKLPKDVSQVILKRVLKNLLIAIAIMAYFFVLNMASTNMKQERLMGDLQVFSGTFLVLGIIFLEKAYKKDNGSDAIHGIELLILAAHTLSIMHVITLYKYNFQIYLLTSSYIFSIYYVFKSILIYTRGKKQYLASLSDISEIIKDEPQKKDAKKRNNNTKKEETKEIVEQIKEKSDEIKEKAKISPKNIKTQEVKKAQKPSKETKEEKPKRKTTTKTKKVENKEGENKKETKETKETTTKTSKTNNTKTTTKVTKTKKKEVK